MRNDNGLTEGFGNMKDVFIKANLSTLSLKYKTTLAITARHTILMRQSCPSSPVMTKDGGQKMSLKDKCGGRAL